MHNEGETAVHLSFIVTTKKPSNIRARAELVWAGFLFAFVLVWGGFFLLLLLFVFCFFFF